RERKTMVKIHFHPDFNERAEWVMPDRGYLSHTVVELDDGSRYPVFFFEPTRLRQELEIDTKSGRPYLAEPGMIVVPEVTRAAIHVAVERLANEGYFQHLRPLTGPSSVAAVNGCPLAEEKRPAG